VRDRGEEDRFDEVESIEHKSSRLFDAREIDSLSGAAGCNCDARDRDRGIVSTTGAGAEFLTFGRNEPVVMTRSRLSGTIAEWSVLRGVVSSRIGVEASGLAEPEVGDGVDLIHDLIACFVGGAGRP